MTTWSLCPLRDELDLLEIRLAELDSVVNVHVIAESNLTQSGMSKPYHFEENRERFERWLHKIRYVKVDDAPAGSRRVDPHEILQATPPEQSDDWAREYHQRNALVRGLEGLEDDDKVLLSDLDEIPRAATVADAAPVDDQILRPRLPIGVYWLNWRWKLPPHPVVCCFTRGATMKLRGPQAVGRMPGSIYGNDNSLGWHPSYLGGVEEIQYKLAAAAHHEGNKPPFNTRENIEQCLRTGKDLFDRDRPMESFPTTELPQYVQDNMDKFNHLIGPSI